jgi:L-lactate dehydrogenase complex protein LldE
LRGLNNRTAPKQLLDNLKGAEVVDLPNAEECCGFGGLFAVKMSDISSAMLQRKLEAIESTGAESVVACDISCLLHIGGGLHRRGSKIEAKHLAELLVEHP